MEHRLEKILSSYLQEIESKLGELSYAVRKEFMAEIRSHLLEKWESGEGQTEESLLQVIAEFGDPQEIAEDYLGKFAGETKPKGSYPPTWLVVALTAFIWPVGIILAWLSPAWSLRDKVIATLIPALGFALFLAMFLVRFVSYDSPALVYERFDELIINQEVLER
jgi:uncharacterized membrane protein